MMTTFYDTTWTDVLCGRTDGPSKCQVVRVTTSRKVANLCYKLHGHVLEVASSARYLGVDISSGLSWNPHID